MEPYQERVIVEKAELQEKFGKLNDFILTNPSYSSLSHWEQQLLLRQANIMSEYITILGERIALFEKGSTT